MASSREKRWAAPSSFTKAEVTEPTAIVAVLEHMGLPAGALPIAAARDLGGFDAA
jgi:hypothetical protein